MKKSVNKTNQVNNLQEIIELQKELNISGDKFMTMAEIVDLYNQQQANLINSALPTRRATNKFTDSEYLF